MHQTLHLMKSRGFPHLRRKALETLQVNLGYKCNQACFHCHVNASPDRKEMMSAETIAEVIDFLRASKVQVLDLTGGAPEDHPEGRRYRAAQQDARLGAARILRAGAGALCHSQADVGGSVDAR